GNSVLWWRSVPSTKRFIRSLRKPRRNHNPRITALSAFLHNQDPERTSRVLVRLRVSGHFGISTCLFRLDVEEFDHLAPLLGFISDELPEVGRRATKWSAANIGEPRADTGIGESGIDLLVELVDGFGGRALGRSNPKPATRFITRYEIACG